MIEETLPVINTTEIIDTDVVLVGGGVIGLSIANEIASLGCECILLEAEDLFASHTSSRNSEVIHAGIYYQTGSLKHKLCVEGKHLLYRYLIQNRIDHLNCGKIIFSIDNHTDEKLHKLANQAINNDVNFEFLPRAKLRDLPPIMSPMNAMFSPSTGILNSGQFISSLRYNFEEKKGLAVHSTKVTNVILEETGILITCQSANDEFVLRCKSLVNAAGANSLNILKKVFPEKYNKYQDFYVKGHYFDAKIKSGIDKLYYPVPNELGLGVHLTIDLHNNVRFGPDTVPVMDPFDYSQSTSECHMKAAIRANFPKIDETTLSYTYAGIRPKIIIDGEISNDFLIENDHNSRFISLLGIESPGLTSSLAIARKVAKLVLNRF